MLGCAHDQKAHGLQWIELIGVANKNTAFATIVGLAKRIMKPVFDVFVELV